MQNSLPSSTAAPKETLPGVPRVIGGLGSLAIVAGSMLGIGIFLVPRVVAGQVNVPWLFFAVWAFGGFNALCGAVAYAELGSMFPKSGGDYVFLRESFGSSVAFASGWLLFFGVFTGSLAAMAVPICQFQLPVLLSPIFGEVNLSAPMPLLGSLWPSLNLERVFAILLVWGFTAINCAGARVASWLQIAVIAVPFALLTVGSIWILIAVGGSVPALPQLDGLSLGLTTDSFIASMVVAFLAVYFAYAGWNAVGYVGGEVERPSRNIPFGLIGGTILTTALYLLLCLAFYRVLGLPGLRNAGEAGTTVAQALGGPALTLVVTALIAMALLGSINGTVLQGGRIAFAMANDGVLPAFLGKLGGRGKAPVAALCLQGLGATLLILTGTFGQLIKLTSVAMLVMGSLAVAALFVLRVRYKDRPRPYKATGYPVLPALYLVVSGFVIAVTLWQAIFPQGAGGGDGASREVYPILGLALFIGAWFIHSLVAKHRCKGPLAKVELAPDGENSHAEGNDGDNAQ